MVKLLPMWKTMGCALALAACASGNHDEVRSAAPAPAEESVVYVENSYFGEMNIYAVSGMTRTRLGAVGAGKTAKFRIPAWMMIRPEIRLQVDPVGPEDGFTLREIALNPGNDLELHIAPTLPMSSWAIVVNR